MSNLIIILFRMIWLLIISICSVMVSSKLVYLLRNTGFLNSMSCFTQDFESVHNNIFLTALSTVTPFNLCLYNFPCSCQMFITVIYYDSRKLWSKVHNKICKVSNFAWSRNFTQSFFYNSIIVNWIQLNY